MSSPSFLATALLSGCIGMISAYLAYRQGKNPYLWFFIGIFFGLLGIAAMFFAPRPKKQKKPTQILTTESFIAGPSNKFWYYLNSAHEQVGPMSLAALSKAWKSGTILPSTFVWNEELSDWKPLQECIETRKISRV